MRYRIQETLARLASLKYQRRFIVDATKDEYVLPGEMLDSTTTLIENTLSNPILSQSFEQDEVDCLREASIVFSHQLKAIPFNNPNTRVTELITKSEGWLAVQAVAQKCLKTLRFDLAGWEEENA